jgi:RNA polymerase sigma-70 factor (ECF subfamily)
MSELKSPASLALLADEVLIELAQKGQRAAFETLFQRYRDRIYTLAYGILGNSSDAKDVVQTTFLKVYKHLGRLKKEPGVGAFLARVATNTAIDILRARKAIPVVSLDEGTLTPQAHPHERPDIYLERKTTKEILMKALAQLPAEQRVVIVLHHLEGLSVETIAKKLKIPVGTVKSRLGRGREALRRKLKGQF